MEVEVCDCGTFDESPSDPHRGFGLTIIRELCDDVKIEQEAERTRVGSYQPPSVVSRLSLASTMRNRLIGAGELNHTTKAVS